MLLLFNQFWQIPASDVAEFCLARFQGKCNDAVGWVAGRVSDL